ncbi:MAG TPA: hypothetical protein PLN33_14845 [Hyphomonadaceae bacterium]|nr:hypothetical protein [Hyphomonadaceae bacterium]HPN05856.1 hypothetical protein [Hyphomonadaceae bacterium]
MDGNSLPDLTVFRPLDIERYAKRLSLEQRGAERGAANQPAPDATSLDDIESEIVGGIVAERTQLRNDVIDRLRSLNELLARARSRLVTTELQNRVAPKISAIEQRAVVDLRDLEQKFQRLRESQADFQGWRDERNLKRPAKAPRGAFVFFADLFLIALVEGGLNLFFFTEGNQLGLLGAFFQALLIAAANIVVCTVIGFALIKRVNSKFLFNKLLGFAAVLVLLIGLPLIHTVVGFYRVARSHVVEGPSPLWTAVGWFSEIFKTPPVPAPAVWGFSHLDELSFIMIAVGIIAGVYAARKGYEFGDRYPDYTKHYNEAEDQRDDYLDLLDDVTGEMLEEQQAASQTVGAFLYDIGPSLQAIDNHTDAKKQLEAAARNYEAELESAANTMLAIYRGANTRARTSAAPAHFGAPVKLANPGFANGAILDPALASLFATSVDVKEARAAAERAQVMAKEQKEKIEAAIAATRAALAKAEQVRDVAS